MAGRDIGGGPKLLYSGSSPPRRKSSHSQSLMDHEDDFNDKKERPSLFRREAVEDSSSRLGVPIRSGALLSWIITLLIFCLILSISVLLLTALYSRKETVNGWLTPAEGAQRLVSTRSGTVEVVHVGEGDEVGIGDEILSISFDSTVQDGVELSQMLSSAADDESNAVRDRMNSQIVNIQLQIHELNERKTSAISRRARLVSSIALQIERIDIANQAVESARTLHERQLLATLQMRQREEALIIARQSLDSMEGDLIELDSQISQIDLQRRRLQISQSEISAEAAQAMARINDRRANFLGQQGQVLEARIPGRISALSVRAASPVQPGQTLAMVVPNGTELEAELWVPSRAVGFVRRGQPVRLMYDAFPYQRFGVGRGRVKLIARSPTEPADLPTALQASEPLYRVLVTLDQQEVDAHGVAWELTPGMRLSADLVLDDRPVAAWLFDPVMAAKSRR